MKVEFAEMVKLTCLIRERTIPLYGNNGNPNGIVPSLIKQVNLKIY